MKKKIGIIGFGNMGSAIGGRLKSNYQIVVFDKDKTKTKKLTGIKVVDSCIDLVNKVDAVILAIKPQDFDSILNEIKDYVRGKLIISIAAGITTAYIEKHLGSARVIRVMPNLPAKIGEGMICLSRGKYTYKTDLTFAERLFGFIGKTKKIKEEKMNADTGVSGSGPGYYYRFCPNTYDANQLIEYENEYFIPCLSASAQSVGFPKATADLLAKITAEGSRLLLIKTKLSPEQLKKQVTSKKGTTEAAMKIFKKEGARYPSDKIPNKQVWKKAVKAAVKRAKELSKKE